jgi:hypothetical protein
MQGLQRLMLGRVTNTRRPRRSWSLAARRARWFRYVTAISREKNARGT